MGRYKHSKSKEFWMAQHVGRYDALPVLIGVGEQRLIFTPV